MLGLAIRSLFPLKLVLATVGSTLELWISPARAELGLLLGGDSSSGSVRSGDYLGCMYCHASCVVVGVRHARGQDFWVVRVRGPEVSAIRVATSNGCNGFIVRPLRENCTAALNGDVEEILLSVLPNTTMANVGVSNIIRRFSAVPNIGRSIARVVLGVGNVVTGLRTSTMGGICVRTRNPYIMATSSVGTSSRIRVLGPSVCVTALSRKTGLGVRLALRGNHKCISTSRGGPTRAIINCVPISSVCAPILGTGFSISGAHINGIASGNGLALRI